METSESTNETFSFSPGFKPGEQIALSSGTVLTVSADPGGTNFVRHKQEKTVETVPGDKQSVYHQAEAR